MSPDAAATTTPREDTELMRRVQLGDEAALGALMQRWELSLKAFIGRIVLNTSEAEELAQETFVRVWQKRGRYRADASFRPWIFAIAVNLARNRLRWWKLRPLVALEDWTEVPSDSGTAAEGETRRLDRAERASAVRDAIARLPTDGSSFSPRTEFCGIRWRSFGRRNASAAGLGETAFDGFF